MKRAEAVAKTLTASIGQITMLVVIVMKMVLAAAMEDIPDVIVWSVQIVAMAEETRILPAAVDPKKEIRTE